MVTTTVRFPDSLYQEVTDFAKENDFSKNQVIKIAVREFLHGRGKEGDITLRHIQRDYSKD